MKKTILLTTLLLLFLVVPVNAQNANSQGKGNSSEKSNKQKVEKVKEKLKDFEKPANSDSQAPGQQKKVQPQQQAPQSGPKLLQEQPKNSTTPTEQPMNRGNGQTNSKLYKEKVTKVSENLQIIGEELEDKSAYTPELEQAAEEIEEVANESEETTEEVAEAIEAIEKQNKFQKMLFGTDYKNLGQLRSNLVKNENQIRKLTRNVERVQDEQTQLMLQEQLTTLTQERERIKTVITENETGFSVLGWARRLFAGYNQEPVETPEEEQLLEDVAEVVDEEVVDETTEEETYQEPTPTVVEEDPTTTL